MEFLYNLNWIYFWTIERIQLVNAERWTKGIDFERWTIELNYFLERQQACQLDKHSKAPW